jgi:DNA-binding transcriptional ArsR family regulator
MEATRLTGPGAGVQKYDLLTALSVTALHGPPVLQTSIMRLMCLITARYNWHHDELSVGQSDMARMWSVNERTVKREVKRLTEAGLLICKRRGVKGRVATYRLNVPRIVALSEAHWAAVGSDYASRMARTHARPDRPADAPKVVALRDYVVPKSDGGSPWDRVKARLSQADAASFQSWIARLEFRSFEHGTLTLSAPSRFIENYVKTHFLQWVMDLSAEEFRGLDRIQFVP